jgi:hypothetical protein
LTESDSKRRTEKLSSAVIHSAISKAIAACWDGINCCQNKSNKLRRFRIDQPPTKSILYLSDNFYSSKKEFHINPEDSCGSMQSILNLPAGLQEFLKCKDNVFCDRNASRSLCVELNRLSRLEERIRTQSCGVRLESVNECILLDELPLFKCFDHVDEKPAFNSLVLNIDYAPLNQKYLQNKNPDIIWQWQSSINLHFFDPFL